MQMSDFRPARAERVKRVLFADLLWRGFVYMGTDYALGTQHSTLARSILFI